MSNEGAEQTDSWGPFCDLTAQGPEGSSVCFQSVSYKMGIIWEDRCAHVTWNASNKKKKNSYFFFTDTLGCRHLIMTELMQSLNWPVWPYQAIAVALFMELLKCMLISSLFFKRFFFLMWFIFQSLYWICYNIASVVLCFGFWLRGIWVLSSLAGDRTCTACVGRWNLNHWTIRKVPWWALLKVKYSEPLMSPLTKLAPLISWWMTGVEQSWGCQQGTEDRTRETPAACNASVPHRIWTLLS